MFLNLVFFSLLHNSLIDSIGMQKGPSLVRLKHMAVKTCRTMDDKLPICTMDKCQAHQCSSSASDLQPDA